MHVRRRCLHQNTARHASCACTPSVFTLDYRLQDNRWWCERVSGTHPCGTTARHTPSWHDGTAHTLVARRHGVSKVEEARDLNIFIIYPMCYISGYGRGSIKVQYTLVTSGMIEVHCTIKVQYTLVASGMVEVHCTIKVQFTLVANRYDRGTIKCSSRLWQIGMVEVSYSFVAKTTVPEALEPCKSKHTCQS